MMTLVVTTPPALSTMMRDTATADEPWHVVTAGEVRATTLQQPRGALFLPRVCSISLSQTLVCEGLYDADGEFLEFPEGTRMLHGFLYSLRNKKERKYELLDVSFASQLKRLDKSRLWPGSPHVYFPIEMLLHVHFHLAPVNSNTKRREEWYVLDKDDHETITTAARTTRE